MTFAQSMPYLGTGVREIDAGYEGLAFLLGHIFDPGVECQRQDGACDHGRCAKLSALLTFVGRRFDDEDALMERGLYPHRDAHQDEHTKLVEDLRAMQVAHVCAERDRAVVRQMVDRWAVHHLHACDVPLGRWAVTRRVVPPVA